MIFAHASAIHTLDLIDELVGRVFEVEDVIAFAWQVVFRIVVVAVQHLEVNERDVFIDLLFLKTRYRSVVIGNEEIVLAQLIFVIAIIGAEDKDRIEQTGLTLDQLVRKMLNAALVHVVHIVENVYLNISAHTHIEDLPSTNSDSEDHGDHSDMLRDRVAGLRHALDLFFIRGSQE